MYYRIASLTVFSQVSLPSFDAFAIEPSEPDVTISVSDEAAPAGTDIQSGVFFHRRFDEGWFYHSSVEDESGLLVDRNYSRLRLIGRDGLEVHRMEKYYIRIALECRLILNGYVSLHSAAVAVGDKAYVFCGPSGIGKSTRACAWIHKFHGSLISGDRPLIHSETLELFGVPWDGKEQCFSNSHYPLEAVFDIRRSETCYIRKMNSVQRRCLLMRQCFLPMWDTDVAVIQMRNVTRLASGAEIIRAFGGPSAEDAGRIYQLTIKKDFLKEEADMKAKTGFVLRNIAGEYVLMPINENITKFNGTLLMSEVAAFVWEKLKNPVSRQDLLTAILDEYEIDEATASSDLDALLEKLKKYDVIDIEEF